MHFNISVDFRTFSITAGSLDGPSGSGQAAIAISPSVGKNLMKRLKNILLNISVGLTVLISHGQQIGNYVNNGSFEETRNPCNLPPPLLYNPVLKYWSAIDTTKNGFSTCHMCYGSVPMNNANTYQWPKTGKGYVLTSIYIQNSIRGYFRNRLKSNLIANKIYCIRFYVNVTNYSCYGIDSYGAFFGDSSLDTITKPYTPKTYLIPQFENPNGNFITDTMNWVPISGTFTANGTEKYLVIGNFRDNANTGLQFIQQPANQVWSDIYLDDVSVMEVNLPAYAGRDTTIYLGDSVFIGRQPDFATDTGCVWYKLPNITTAIDTVSGLWVKPAVTSTYVVRQELDCSTRKWDTVVVTINTNLVGIDKLQQLTNNITLAPNPTSGNLRISFSDQISPDFNSFSIINSLGQTIHKADLISNTVDIGISNLTPGLYEIHFKSNFSTVTKKFVKTSD
jgi:hypothetical protein